MGRTPRSGRRLTVVMFTDIVDSTAQRQRLGERRAEELRVTVDGLHTDVASANGGRIVKHLGDGMMASFDSASGAMQAAIGIQVELERLRERLPEPVLLRIGISAGDVVVDDDDDLFGMPVVQAARLCNAADDGRILVADIVRESSGRDPDFDLHTPTRMTLKGLDGETTAWKLDWVAEELEPQLPTALHRDERFGFVGRSAEWNRLVQAWNRATAGEIQIAVITGEAGVGKTRLVAEFADWVRTGGATLLFGSNDEGLDVPYQPFAEMLQSYIESQPSWAVGRRLGDARGELVRLLPDLHEYVDDLGPPLVADPETERSRMFDAVAQWLSELASTEPVLVVVDDLHWAAESTRQLLRHVAVSRDAPGVLVVATQRPTDSSGTVIPSLPVPPQRLHELELPNFDTQTVLDFIEVAAGHSMHEFGPQLAERIHAQTGGNPFFCRELALHLVDSGELVQREGRWVLTVPLETVGIPDSIRRVIDERLTRVSDDVRHTLLWAAVIGQEIDVTLLTGAIDKSEDAVLHALEQCVEARLLEERGLDTFVFPHALVRSALDESISRTRRRSMHRKIAAELSRRRDRGEPVAVGELARHFELGATDDQVTQAVELCIEAGDQSTEQLAYEAAVEFYERAVGILDRSPIGRADLGSVSDAAIKLAAAAHRAGDPRAFELANTAVVAADRSGDPDRFARALIASSRGSTSLTGTVNVERVERLEDARDRLPTADDPVRAKLLAVLATELQFSGEIDRVIETSDQALAMARRLDDDETLVFVLVERLASIRHPDQLDAQLGDVIELVRRSRSMRDQRSEFFGALRAIEVRLAFNDLDGARAEVMATTRIASDLRQPTMSVRAIRGELELAWIRGDLDAAEALLDELIDTARDINQEMQYTGTYLGFRSKLASARGRPDIAVESFTTLASLPRGTDGFRAGLAVAEHLAGDTEAARENYAQLIAKGVENLSHDLTRVHTLCFVASVCASLGDVDRAPLIDDQLRRYHDRWVVSGAGSYGPVKHFLARLEALVGRHDEAAESFADASRRCQAMEAPILEAWNQVAWAGFLVDTGSLDDADELTQAALATGRRYGAGGVESAAHAVITRIAESTVVGHPASGSAP